MNAKLKSLGEIPEQYRCCEATILRILAWQDKIFEVDAVDVILRTCACPHCGAKSVGNGLRCANGGRIPADCVEIEEGS